MALRQRISGGPGADIEFTWSREGFRDLTTARNEPIFRHMTRVLTVALDAIKQEAPVGQPDPLGRPRQFPPGNLRDRHVKRLDVVDGQVVGTIRTEGVTYALWAHEGAPPHVMPQKTAAAIPLTKSGRADRRYKKRQSGVYVFVVGGVKVVTPGPIHHPGNEPNRWMLRGAERVVGPGRVRSR